MLQNMGPNTRKRKHAVGTGPLLGSIKKKKTLVGDGLGKDFHQEDAIEDGQDFHRFVPTYLFQVKGRAHKRRQSPEQSKVSKKRKVTMDMAKAEVQGHVEDVLVFIQEKQENIIGSQFGMEHRQTRSPDLKSILGHQEMQTDSSKKSNIHNPIFNKTKDALNQFKDMVNRYQASGTCEHSITMPSWVRWTQDKKDLEALDEHAIRTAARLISSLIVPDSSPSIKDPPNIKDELARMAWEFFPEETPQMAKDTWGRIAQEQIKAFTHVLRSMEKR